MLLTLFVMKGVNKIPNKIVPLPSEMYVSLKNQLHVIFRFVSEVCGCRIVRWNLGTHAEVNKAG